jgi:hypothetical protein
MAMTTITAITDSTAAMGKLTVMTRAIAARVATQGGNTLQTSIFSTV